MLGNELVEENVGQTMYLLSLTLAATAFSTSAAAHEYAIFVG